MGVADKFSCHVVLFEKRPAFPKSAGVEALYPKKTCRAISERI